jgi:predicted RND superfamily exporter protein
MRKSGRTPKEAVAYIFTHTMPALLVTTTILVAAFATFLGAQFIPNRTFGILVAFILGVALIADMTFLPALLMHRKKDISG